MDKEHLSSFFEALQVSNDGSYCRKCDDMVVPLGNPEDMAAFAGCTGLTSIEIPASVANIHDGFFRYSFCPDLLLNN